MALQMGQCHSAIDVYCRQLGYETGFGVLQNPGDGTAIIGCGLGRGHGLDKLPGTLHRQRQLYQFALRVSAACNSRHRRLLSSAAMETGFGVLQQQGAMRRS